MNVMQDYLGDVLEALRWPGETNVNFEVEENGKTVYLDVDLPEIEDFPKRPLQSRLGLQAKDESLGLRTAGTTYFIYVGLRSAIEPARMQTTGPKSLTNTPGNRNAKRVASNQRRRPDDFSVSTAPYTICSELAVIISKRSIIDS